MVEVLKLTERERESSIQGRNGDSTRKQSVWAGEGGRMREASVCLPFKMGTGHTNKNNSPFFVSFLIFSPFLCKMMMQVVIPPIL